MLFKVIYYNCVWTISFSVSPAILPSSSWLSLWMLRKLSELLLKIESNCKYTVKLEDL